MTVPPLQSRLNIYELFLEHSGLGFWMRLENWEGMCAGNMRTSVFKAQEAIEQAKAKGFIE